MVAYTPSYAKYGILYTAGGAPCMLPQTFATKDEANREAPYYIERLPYGCIDWWVVKLEKPKLR